jgi:hypothetical protein
MRKLANPALQDAMTWMQRAHQSQQMMATPMLLRFQRAFDEIDAQLTTLGVQPSAPGLPTVADLQARLEAAHGEFVGLQQQLAGVQDSLQFITQLREDLQLPPETTIDELYDKLAAIVKVPVPADAAKGRRAQGVRA